MAQYINKDALVAEIERLAEVQPTNEFQPKEQNKIDWLSGKMFAINSIRVFLDTLEVKEKDLELTCEDLATIEKLGDDFIKHNQTPMSDEEFYKEVLKRLKAQKGEEV